MVAAWREYSAVPDEEPSVIGPEPVGPQPMPRMLWRAAHQALGAPDDTPEWSRVPAVLLEEAIQCGTGRGRRRAAVRRPPAVGRAAAALRHPRRTQLRPGTAEPLQRCPLARWGRRDDSGRVGPGCEQATRLEARLAGQQRFLDRMDARADARDRWWLPTAKRSRRHNAQAEN